MITIVSPKAVRSLLALVVAWPIHGSPIAFRCLPRSGKLNQRRTHSVGTHHPRYSVVTAWPTILGKPRFVNHAVLIPVADLGQTTGCGQHGPHVGAYRLSCRWRGCTNSGSVGL